LMKGRTGRGPRRDALTIEGKEAREKRLKLEKEAAERRAQKALDAIENDTGHDDYAADDDLPF